MKNIISINLLLVSLLIFSCAGNAGSGWEKMSLLEYGVTSDITAPTDAVVKTNDLGVMKDITIEKKEEDYFVQILASQATTTNIAEVKAQQMALVKGESIFSKIISEDDDGFFFEKQIDSTRMTYDFRHIKLKGDREYIYQTGMMGFFTEAQAKNMFEAVK